MISAQDRARFSSDGGAAEGTTTSLLVGSKRKIDDADVGDDRCLKKHKVVLPKSMQKHQWIIVSTSVGFGLAPQLQCCTSHTSHANLVNEVVRKWSEGMRITSLNFGGRMWTAVFDALNSGYTKQVFHYCHESHFPGDWVRRKWEETYFITSVAGSENGWGVVCSMMQEDRKYKQQCYVVSSTFPSKWITEKWNAKYYITAITTQGIAQLQWCVVMSRGAPFRDQCVELDFQYPSQSIHARWKENYMITAVAGTQDQCAFVLSKGHTHGQEQRCTRISDEPLQNIRENWKDSLFVSCLAYGRIS